MVSVRFAIRVAIASCAVVASGASAGEAGPSVSPEVMREYRQPVARWPPFVVDEGVLAQELGELPPLAPEPWHTPVSEALGKLLFFDPRLSASGQIACASCHDPELGWADGRRFPFGHDRTPGRRNAMTLLNVGYFDRWSWDGRAESLAQQVSRAIESPIEMNADLGEIVARLNGIDDYARAFAAAFGGMPRRRASARRWPLSRVRFDRGVAGSTSSRAATTSGSATAKSRVFISSAPERGA